MTIEEIERACDESRPIDFSRHEVEAPELVLREIFHVMGFPVEFRTNSMEVMAMMRELMVRESMVRELWTTPSPGVYCEAEKRFDTRPIQVDVHLVEDDASECPPTPEYSIMQPVLLCVANAKNFSVADLELGRTQMTIARSTLQYRSYLAWFFLGSAAMTHISTRFAMPVHAACVALNGRGVLLCADSGGGKSTLSFACARAGWTYVTDDASYLLHCGSGRRVTGNCHQIRFRPSAAELFQEIDGLEITPRAAGKPSIELPTASMKNVACAPTAHVDFLVFLNRRAQGPPDLRPYRKDVARHFLRQTLYAPPALLPAQYAAAERLLTAEIFELRYTELDWAVHRLETLVREGR